jgi:hypothetical protein
MEFISRLVAKSFHVPHRSLFYTAADTVPRARKTEAAHLTKHAFASILKRVIHSTRRERRFAMATDSFGQTVYLTNEMADRIIEAMERDKANPPKPRVHKIKWGDSKEIAKKLEAQYAK